MKEKDKRDSINEEEQSNESIFQKKEFFTKQNIRFLFFSICSLITYSLFVWTLFWKEEFLDSGIYFCVLFIELIFLSIDVRGIKKRIVGGSLFLLGIIFCLLIPNKTWQVLTAVWLSLITIGYLLVYLRDYFNNVREISWFTYFTSGGYIFTLLTSITFGFAILGINTKFPFQCDQISHVNEMLLEKTTYGRFSKKEESVNERIILNEDRKEQVQEGDDKTIILEARDVFKENMVDGFIQTKDSINNKVCEAIISQIDQIYQNPVFQIGAVFGIYLLFYGVIRVFVWVITILGYIIFTIARRAGLYKVEKHNAIVEEVL